MLYLDPYLPIPQYPDIPEYMIGSYVSIIPTFNTNVDYCISNPNINIPNIIFNNKTGVIMGIIKEYYTSQKYIITCFNSIGNSSTLININIKDINIFDGCNNDNYSLLNITIYTKLSPDIMSLIIYDKNNDSVITLNEEKWNINSIYNYFICIPQGEYKLNRISKNNGWEYQSVLISLYDNIIGNYSLNINEFSKLIDINCIL